MDQLVLWWRKVKTAREQIGEPPLSVSDTKILEQLISALGHPAALGAWALAHDVDQETPGFNDFNNRVCIMDAYLLGRGLLKVPDDPPTTAHENDMLGQVIRQQQANDVVTDYLSGYGSGKVH